MLENLRNQLNQLDRELMQKVAKRQQLVAQIGQSKREQGIGTRDFAREKVVIDNARRIAQEEQLPPELAEDLMRLLINSSLQRQEQDSIDARAPVSAGTALVIGGLGQMGKWFSDFLASQGYEIKISDVAHQDTPYQRVENWQASVEQFQIIVVATPIKQSITILDELTQLKPDSLIFDLSSLKSPLRRALRALSDTGCKVTSIHPMFGPGTRLLSGQHVIFIDLGHTQAISEAKALFEPTMAVQVDMSLEDHDRLVAYILGLSHVLNIAFFTALRESGEDAQRLAQLSSTTFDAQLQIAGNVARENPHLYFEIQNLNDYRRAPLNALTDALTRIKQLIEQDDEQGFVRLMDQGRAYINQRKPTGSDPGLSI